MPRNGAHRALSSADATELALQDITSIVMAISKSSGGAVHRLRTSEDGQSGGARDPEASTLYVNSVDKALRILSVFSAQRRHLSMTQIAKLADLGMGAAQRFTFTLVHLNLLRRDPATKLYELSPHMLDFANQFIGSNELVGLATPFLQQLSAETEETINLALLDDTEVVYVQRLVSRHVLTPEVIVGSRLPAFCTSSGLAMLSALPEAEARDILSRSTLTRLTKFTVTDPDAIIKRLEVFRQRGYALVEEETHLGDIAMAVAVVGANKRPRGAINVSMSRARWNGAETEERIASLLVAAGLAISSRG